MIALIYLTDEQLRFQRNLLLNSPEAGDLKTKERIEEIDEILKKRDEYDAISEFHGG